MERDTLPDLGAGARTGDRFRIEAVLGRGATSTVYRAHDEVLGRDVALKVLRGSLAAGTIAARRFEREAQLVARLDHPSIVQLYASGWLETRQPWVALELVPGETLETILAREKRLPLGRAIEILDPVLDALATAHHVHVIHRDLKPANLMIDGARVKLLDFGVGRDLADEGPRITAPPQVVGTIGYLAPEQLVPVGEIDGRVDLWAVGVLFYSMICGEAPFGLRSTRVISRIMEADPKPPSALVPELSGSIDAFVRRALAKDPDARWRSAAAMREALLDLE